MPTIIDGERIYSEDEIHALEAITADDPSAVLNELTEMGVFGVYMYALTEAQRLRRVAEDSLRSADYWDRFKTEHVSPVSSSRTLNKFAAVGWLDQQAALEVTDENQGAWVLRLFRRVTRQDPNGSNFDYKVAKRKEVIEQKLNDIREVRTNG
jgi:hypothetical protein